MRKLGLGFSEHAKRKGVTISERMEQLDDEVKIGFLRAFYSPREM
jgi:hypothetical protein